MFRQGQLAVHGLAILLGRNEAGISNRGRTFLHHAVLFALWAGFLQLSIHLHQTTTHITLITTRFEKNICKEAQNEISFGTKHNKLKICHQIWMWYYLQNTNYINIKFTDESLDKSYVFSNNVTRYRLRILVYVMSHNINNKK